MEKVMEEVAQRIKKTVERYGYRKVVIHLPSGLMKYWEKLRDCSREVFFLSDPCFGGCDVPLHYLKALKADAIFNIGHSKPPFLQLPSNVHFIEVQLKFEPTFIPSCTRVGIVYVIHYRDAALRYAEQLRKMGKEVFMGGKPGFMGRYNGQITGCDVEAARKVVDKVDCFVVCADGKFHAEAVAGLGKPTYNWLGEKVKARRYPLPMLSTAEKVGIILSIKPGQFFMEIAERLRREMEGRGKKVIVVVGDTITGEVENYKVDLWISAACPRIAENFRGIPASLALSYLTEK